MDVLPSVSVLVIGLLPEPDVPPDTQAGFAIRAGTVVLIAALLPLRRWRPLPVAVLAGAITLIAPAWSHSTSGYLLATAIALYRVATDLRPRTAFLSSGATAAVLLVAVVIGGDPGSHYERYVQPVAIVGVALAAGLATRNRRAYVAAIVERADRAERTRELEARRRVAEERLRIARDLHDAAAHQIAAINLHAGVASNALPERPEEAERALAVIRDAARGVLDEISALLRVLRDESDLGAVPEPVAAAEELDALVETFGRSGLEVSLGVRGRLEDLRGPTAVVTYRTVQEGLANALKHGSAGRADVRIDVRQAAVSIRVTNPARFEEPASVPGSGRHGLLGVRERVDSVHGRMKAGEEAGEFVLQVDLPLALEATR
jgi:signal transduction histidine kinase